MFDGSSDHVIVPKTHINRYGVRLRNVMRKKIRCSHCEEYMDADEFHFNPITDKKRVKATFFRGKWYFSRMTVCKHCYFQRLKLQQALKVG